MRVWLVFAGNAFIPYMLHIKWSFAATCSGKWRVKCEGPADWPSLFVYYCFNYMPSSITTMPLAGKFFLFCFVVVESTLGRRGS